MNASTFDRIEVVESPSRRYVPKPTDEQLTRFAEAHCVRLPDAYREFAIRFGAGELAGFYRIYAPTDGDERMRRRADVATFNDDSRRGDRLALGVTLFASDIGGGWYGWNAGRPEGDTAAERAVVRIDDDGDLEVVAASFAEFVEKCCRRAMWNDRDAEEVWTFGRFTVATGK